MVIDVGNVDDGAAVYSAARNDLSTQTFLRASETTADPDGIKTGTSVSYQWFNYRTGEDLPNANALTHSIPVSEVGSRDEYGIRISYTDGADVEEVIEVIDAPLILQLDRIIHVNEGETDILDSFTVTDKAGNAISSSSLTFRFHDFSNGSLKASVNGFTIANDGAIAADSALDYESLSDDEKANGIQLTLVLQQGSDSSTVTHYIITIMVADVVEQGASPAIIPDRQSFAHQDSYDPDDLGLTPMPDADPSAG